ncbi:SET domain-containing protein [Aaosphaeria arxii CBS 175.79]|uniref:SET domain-containing protein n=1 Tax=Aaosphaeria arxii CBS 175.79 TaxID=1450172 RepID=A0A6A5XZC0_9PLEO|nr:SET domain-containing protein [Aaosphaeria arxii CBS 175.79]KAF2018542.1 SET domain-containing protein [Aaosphaeria arxii CBS 175.79]
MYTVSSALAFFSFALGSTGTYLPSHSHHLSHQCWHEHPFSTVTLQCLDGGNSENVETIRGRLITPGSPSRPAFRISSDTSQYGPWTHQPICTDVLQSLGSPLCVYTSASFSNGRGISIFTTPKIAEEFASLPAIQDPTILETRSINIDSGTWHVQEMSGKGMGMVAKRNLKFKDRITGYTPALLAHVEDELSTLERERFFRLAVNQLPDAMRDMYLRLATVYGDPRVRVQDIVKANTFQLDIGGQNHLAVFPETSRLNHACAPNAQYYLEPTLLTHIVHATRPIQQGEEITIAYTSPVDFTKVRQQNLQNGFHFTCTCSRCSDQARSDATLKQIQDLQERLNDWSASSTASPKTAEKLLQIYRQEGLEGFLTIPYGFAALAYNAVGDTKKAIKYANLAKELTLMKDGMWSANLGMYEDILKDARAHWSYNRRL